MTVELKKDETIYCFTRHVSKSGMTRHISFYVMRDNKPSWINYKIEKTLGYKPNKYLDAIVVRGCGMDMGFKVVDDLSHKLFGEGYKLKHHWL